MTTPTPRPDEPELDLETDSRFPSGPWKGFFLQPGVSGRCWMELNLTFRKGLIRGDGRDRVGDFFFVGRYETDSGKCWWTKRYLGRHDIAYQGYNESRGIWGTWEDPEASHWRGGFHIWPEAMGDPYAKALSEAIPEPVAVGSEAGVPLPA